jgi:hypothetical protein
MGDWGKSFKKPSSVPTVLLDAAWIANAKSMATELIGLATHAKNLAEVLRQSR